MKDVKKAVFSFEGYKIKEFSFSDLAHNDNETIDIDFYPSGVFKEVEKEYTVVLAFSASTETNDNVDSVNICNVLMEAKFVFRDQITFEEIPDYFFRNSLGIIFPYLRAFVSTLTFQANIQPPMILPILNLTQLEEQFKNETKIIKQ